MENNHSNNQDSIKLNDVAKQYILAVLSVYDELEIRERSKYDSEIS